MRKANCPICNGKLKSMSDMDGIKILKCQDCKSEVRFGSWEAQRYFIDDEKISPVIKRKQVSG
jgi:ribosomal protein L37AE/L43A